MADEQIKVDELPVNWLVLDHHVQSGNVEFVRMGTNNARECNDETHFHTKGGLCKTCHNANRKPLGTKHIQLIAANPYMQDYDNPYQWDITMYFQHPNGNTVYPIDGVSRKIYELYKSLKKQGKDFFIYKVSEEK